MPELTNEVPLGPRIRHFRTEKSWSLTELARRADISRSYLYQLERGESVPTQNKIRSLAEAFGVLPSELLGEHPDNPEIPESLREFAAAEKLGSADVRMLAQIQYRGRRPGSIEEWRAIYTIIKGMLQSA